MGEIWTSGHGPWREPELWAPFGIPFESVAFLAAAGVALLVAEWLRWLSGSHVLGNAGAALVLAGGATLGVVPDWALAAFALLWAIAEVAALRARRQQRSQ